MTKHGDSSSLFSEASCARPQGSVECLGMTFEDDEKRREYFLEKLREKLKDQEFRKIEGFPIGEDEDILALSDPPYYTVCSNPFIEDFIEHYGKPYDPDVPYSREPFFCLTSRNSAIWPRTTHPSRPRIAGMYPPRTRPEIWRNCVNES